MLQPLIVVAEFDRADELISPLRADYRVEVAATGDAALKICRKCQVDLVISRVVFREGLNGIDLIEELARLNVPPKMLLVTPFRLNILRVVPGFPPKGVPLLHIPAPPEVLLNQVRELLRDR